MAKIGINDVVFATATLKNRRRLNLKLSGIGSDGDILTEIRRVAGDAIGLIHVTLRNATQGWSRCVSFYLKPRMREGIQLSLF